MSPAVRGTRRGEWSRERTVPERVSWAIDNRAQLPAMGERSRERAIEYYAAERNYPQLLDTLAEVVQKPVLAGDG